MNKSIPTIYPKLNIVLQELVNSVQKILSKNFIGAYLQGSFALGDFDLHSDVDFIIAIEGELSEEQIRSLQMMHERIYSLTSSWAQHLEGSYFPREVLRHCSRRWKKLWYLDNGARSLIRSVHCNTIVVRWVVRECGVVLAGSAPELLVDPIPVEMLQEEIKEVITGWGQAIIDNPDQCNNRFYQSFIVLSYCRMLHDLSMGTVGSKLRGAEWAKTNLDSSWSRLIDRAWNG